MNDDVDSDEPSPCVATTSRGHALVLAASLVLAALLVAVPSAATASDSTREESTSASERPELPRPELRRPNRVPARFRITLGPMVALRSMQFEGDGTSIEHRPEPYRGMTLSAGGELWTFEDPALALALDVDLGYGLARNRSLNPRGGPSPATELLLGGARLMAYRPLSPSLGLGLGLGMQATSATIAPNRTYTGHRYLSADATLKVRWYLAGKELSAALEGGLYPVVSTDNSNNAHGSSTSFGMRTRGEIAWAPFTDARRYAWHGWTFLASYRYQRFRSQFPVSPIGLRGGISLDQQHVVALSVGYVIH